MAQRCLGIDKRLPTEEERVMQARDIDDALRILEGIIDRQRDHRSPLAFFAALYRAVTPRGRPCRFSTAAPT